LIIITIIIIYLHCAKCLDAVIGGGLSAFESGRVEYLLLASPRLDLLEAFVHVERQLELERVDGERRLEQPRRRGAVVRGRVLRRTAAGHDQRDRLGLMVVVGVFASASAESPRHCHRRRLDVPSPERTTVSCTTRDTRSTASFTAQPVVRVRGMRGNAVPGPLKIAGERSQAPRSR